MPAPIVVGIDFSPDSERAFQAAMGLAQDLQVSLVLVHAIPTWMYLDGGGAAVALDSDSEARVTETDAITLTTEWAARARAKGLEVETVVRKEVPERLIRNEAMRTDAALVVVGTHGRTGARRLIMGSVAEKVVRQSERPVLVVPASFRPKART